MAFIDDLKTDQRTQILVAGMVFFAIAFPLYFNYAASNVDEFEASGPIGNYSVEGTYSFHEIASGSQYTLTMVQPLKLLQIQMLLEMNSKAKIWLV